MSVASIFEPEDCEVDLVEASASCCICGVPSVENIIHCSSENCPIVCYHKQCLGLDVGDEVACNWMCEFCSSPWTSGKRKEDGPSEGQGEASTSKTNDSDPSVEERKTRTKAKCKPFLQRDSVVAEASSLLADVLKSVDTDPFYKDSSISTFARMAVQDGPLFNEFSRNIVSMVCDCLSAGEGYTVGQTANTQIFRAFHKCRSGVEVMSAWEAYLDHHCIGGGTQMRRKVLQIVLRLMLQKLLHMHNDSPQDEETDFTMTPEEEGVLRLVVGYIPFALLKRYAKLKSEHAKEFVDVLQSWKAADDDTTEAHSFLSYTSVWLTLQNRGGLFKVSDIVYRFFRVVEKVVRHELKMWKIVASTSSPKETLLEAVMSNPTVQTCWEKLICDQLTQESADALFTSVMNYYVKIRITHFVRLYVNLKKREQNKASRKGDKGLRKQLQKSSKK